MNTLKVHYHPDIKNMDGKTIFTRRATRAITLDGEKILLLYTERYDDYTLPGGGLDANEDKLEGMIRELSEETGASEISNIKPFGIYEEYRPWHKPDFDIQHMISYCYTCDINKKLGASHMESYESNNGMVPKWVSLNEAIKHNKNTLKTSDKKGMSIEREIFLLELIQEKLF